MAQQFNISFRTVRSLWDQIKNSNKSGSQVNISSGKVGKCERKGKDCAALNSAIETVK